MVHDIELKDDKHQRPETTGIASVIAGLTALHVDDERRIEEGSRLFEAMYASLRASVISRLSAWWATSSTIP